LSPILWRLFKFILSIATRENMFFCDHSKIGILPKPTNILFIVLIYLWYMWGLTHDIYWFKAIHLRSIAKKVINHCRPLMPDGIHLFFWTRFRRREKPDLSLYAERQARKHLVPFFVTSSVWRGRGSNPRPPAYGANALTTEL